MKVAILNTNDISGGAARAAYGLYTNLRSLDVDVNYFVKDKKKIDDRIIKVSDEYSIADKANRKLFEDKIDKFRTPLSNTLFQIQYTNPNRFPIKIFRDFDIINLHWIAYFLSPEIIYNIAREKHLVWTLHDQAPITGGCHYTSGCEGFKLDCNKCKQAIFPDEKNLPHLYFEEKLKFLSILPITFVVASRWMEECVKESRLFSSHRIEYIPYSIDTTSTFKPIDKEKAKNRLGIPHRKVTILFGADNSNEIRKGFQYLLEAIKKIKNDTLLKDLILQEQIQLVSLGKINPEITNLGIPWVSIERIDNNSKLNDFYNSGDILVLPSIEDNLPLTMLESISTGTPVAAFSVGGMKDIIKSGINGELAQSVSSEGLAEAMLKLIEKCTSLDSDILRDSSSSFAENKFKNPIEAKKYLDLYLDLNKRKPQLVLLNSKSKLKNFKNLFLFEYISLYLRILTFPLLSKIYILFFPEILKKIWRRYRN